MKVGIAGIGLIGGSMARAFKAAGHEVLVHDIFASIVGYAELAGVSDGELSDAAVGSCDLLLVALYPNDAVKYLERIAPLVSKEALVMDCCGTKRKVCEAGFRLARRFGFTFVGGHPMAGKHLSGFKNSSSLLFKGAPLVIVPPPRADAALLQRVKDAMAPAGFGRISVTTAERHDSVIAFTSQLPHVVSNAFIKSPTALGFSGFSAGSFRDFTRVAALNEDMWTDLFMENADNLTRELGTLIRSLEEYRDAIGDGDAGRLRDLLAEGCKAKKDSEQKCSRQ